MRLLILASEFPPGPGGIGAHAHQLSQGLHELGWTVCVAAPQDYADDAEIRSFNDGLTFDLVRLPSGGPVLQRLTRRLLETRRIIRTFEPDVILASGKGAVWLGALQATKTPWCAVAHGTDVSLSGYGTRLATQQSFARADAVVCVSRHTAERMDEVGYRVQRREVIYNGADSKKYRRLPDEEIKRIRATFDLGDARILLTVGRVSERKGQDVVIRSLPALLRRCPNLLYVAAGLPEKAQEYEELARSLGVEDHVRFLGIVESGDLPGLQNAADVFVMVSKETDGGDVEGYGIAVVEAALCGVPGVVSRRSGLTEAIVDGETGLAVEPYDPAATAKVISQLLEDEALRAKLGYAAEARARRSQTWARCVSEYDDFLRQITEPAVQPAFDT